MYLFLLFIFIDLELDGNSLFIVLVIFWEVEIVCIIVFCEVWGNMVLSCCLIMVLFNGCLGGEVFFFWWLLVKEELFFRLLSIVDEGVEFLLYVGIINCFML